MSEKDIKTIETTVDNFFDGAIKLEQPKDSYRAGTDAVLLACYNTITENDTVVDLGCGVGAVSLCLSYRTKARVIGIEKEGLFANLAQKNALRNGIQNFSVINEDIMNIMDNVPFEKVSHVLSNPPYLPSDKGMLSQSYLKDIGNRETTAKLEDFIFFAHKILKPKGWFWIVQRADRLQDILLSLNRYKYGNILLSPVYTKPCSIASRVLIGAQKDNNSPISINPPLYLRDENNNPTKISEDIAKKGKSIIEYYNER